MMKRIEGGGESAPDRGGAGGRQLLATDDGGEAGKARFAPPQRRHAGERQYRLQPRVEVDQRIDGVVEVVLGVEVNGHCKLQSPFPRKRSMPSVFRFAPSPNGLLHLGHVFSALQNFDSARQSGGRFLLRIEDIDTTRCRPEFEAAIFEDLAWLGIEWETPVRRQSEHIPVYRDAIQRLADQGLVYPAFESRAEIMRLVAQQDAKGKWPRDPDGTPVYPGVAKSLPAGERARLIQSGAPYALRLDMMAACRLVGDLAWTEQGAGPLGETGAIRANPAAWGDVVLARK